MKRWKSILGNGKVTGGFAPTAALLRPARTRIISHAWDVARLWAWKSCVMSAQVPRPDERVAALPPGAPVSADETMTIEEFVADARKRIESIGLHFGFSHTDVGGNTYVASSESAGGCYGQPLAEAMQYQDGRLWYSFNLRSLSPIVSMKRGKHGIQL